MQFLLPPRTKTDQGRTRMVGFEIEFGGVSLPKACEIIQSLCGGEIHKKNTFSYSVKKTPHGDFEVESDARFLSQARYQTYLEQLGVKSPMILSAVEFVISESVAGNLLPFEIAMPPLPVDDLQIADEIREALFRASAFGTHSSIFAAFGCQMNAELPDFKVETMLNTLRAYFLLEDGLKEVAQIALARNVAPYIRPFPAGYIDLVLTVDYAPTLTKFMTDYLTWNSTRNRPLDLLPLLSHLDHDLVFQFPVEKDMIKPRPTFHYRLPNSEIDDPNWSLAREWNRWVHIEKLAENTPQLHELCRTYERLKTESLIFPHSDWILVTRDWVHGEH